ncbi:hypothetical protein MCEMIH15_02842 [Caulobacteraceae bacterium]
MSAASLDAIELAVKLEGRLQGKRSAALNRSKSLG